MNSSAVAARVVIAALVAHGVRHVVLCPGSRSAPLAYALHAAEQAGDLLLHVRHDERSAGFVALGIGRVAGSGPSAVVTTSGTAVANLFPAVLEAHHADVPLLVLSADRPHALRGTWANQTTELQAGLFAGALRFAADLPAVSSADSAAATSWAAAVGSAVRAARGQDGAARPGPAHLDLAFEDPLVPDDDDEPPAAAPTLPRRAERPSAGPPMVLDDGPRTVVVAGDGAGSGARRLAEAAGWPLLAEPSSHARSGPNAIGPYRLLLEDERLGGRIERVVAFGRPTLSRQVTRLLARPDVELVLVETSPGRPDPGRVATRTPRPPVPGWVSDRPEGFHRRPADPWLTAWLGAGRQARRAVDDVLDRRAAAGELTGPLVAREVAAASGPGERLVVAASNPVRDLDLAAHPFDVQGSGLGAPPGIDADGYPHVASNRGLSGIDGTLSTAIGVARASAHPTRALVGDLAFLHDVGGLAVPTAERVHVRLQVVVLNDDGGGIFGLLEHGEPARAASFERVFGTPHGADLAALCAGFDVPHALARDLSELRQAVRVVRAGLSVLEVRADRSKLRALHADLRAAVADALALGPDSGSGHEM